MCDLLGFPHDEHLLMFSTSFNALPAMNRDRFFMYDVFFFGTARSIASQISESTDGKERCIATGIKRRDNGDMGLDRDSTSGPVVGARICHAGRRDRSGS